MPLLVPKNLAGGLGVAWGMAEEGSSCVCVRQQYRYSADGSLFHEVFVWC